MSTAANITRLTRYLDSKTAEWNRKPDMNRLYGDCPKTLSTQPDTRYTLTCSFSFNDLSTTLAAMCAGSNGIAYRVAFPIRCISETEAQNLGVFVQSVNEGMPVGRLFMEEGCLYWTMGINTEHILEENLFLSYYLSGYLSSVVKPLGIMTPFILSAMLGGDAKALAQQATEACTRPEPQEEVDAETAAMLAEWRAQSEQEEYDEYHQLVQAWEIDLPDSSDVPELTHWMNLLKEWANS